MKPYVDIVGSGVGTTRLLFPGNTALETIKGADQTELRNLTVINDGSGTSSFALGIQVSNATMSIRNVHVTSSGGTFNYAVYLTSDASATLENVKSTAEGGSSAVALYVFNSAVTVYESILTAIDETNANGIYMTGSGSPYEVSIVDSQVHSSIRTIRLTTTFTVQVANSLLSDAAIELNGGTLSCVASRDEDGQELTSSCAASLRLPDRSGAYAFTCSASESSLNRTVNTPGTELVDVASGDEAGRCLIDFGFDVSDLIWTVSAASAAEPLLVSCEQIAPSQLSCLQTTVQGEGIDGRIHIVLH